MSKSYREARNEGAQLLKAAGIDENLLDTEYLLMNVSGYNRSELFFHQSDIMPEEQYEAFCGQLSRRKMREPLQYIMGSRNFMGFDFICTPDVLIPRPDTEILVEKALQCMKKLAAVKPLDTMRILDLCTGSGCVAVSVAILGKDIVGRTEQLGLQVSASDISPAALDVAERNAAENGAEITFIESNLFEKIEGLYDLITANPPYIGTDDIAGLEPEVAVFEPKLALDGGSDGLFFYRQIVSEAGRYLTDGGYLVVEIGCDQGDAVSRLFMEKGFLDVKVFKDLAGLDRVVQAYIRRGN